VEWVWGLLQPGFVRWAPPASRDHFNHCHYLDSRQQRLPHDYVLQLWHSHLLRPTCTIRLCPPRIFNLSTPLFVSRPEGRIRAWVHSNPSFTARTATGQCRETFSVARYDVAIVFLRRDWDGGGRSSQPAGRRTRTRRRRRRQHGQLISAILAAIVVNRFSVFFCLTGPFQ